MSRIKTTFGEFEAHEAEPILKALYLVYREARGCAYMTGFREFAGNTNTKILRDRIETVDELLPGLAPQSDPSQQETK